MVKEKQVLETGIQAYIYAASGSPSVRTPRNVS
jgi:hypothetical protein